MFVTNSQLVIIVSVSSHIIKMNPQELIDKLVSWRGRDGGGSSGPTSSGYKCTTNTLTALNTPLPDTRVSRLGCCGDRNVGKLGDNSFLPPCCCAWDDFSFSDSEPSSPELFGDNQESFGRISQFRPSDGQWDRCNQTRIGSSYSTARHEVTT